MGLHQSVKQDKKHDKEVIFPINSYTSIYELGIPIS